MINPEEALSGHCPVCRGSMRKAEVERIVVKHQGHAVGASPESVDKSVETFVETQIFMCHLVRQKAHGQPWRYEDINSCRYAQEVAMKLREEASDHAT